MRIFPVIILALVVLSGLALAEPQVPSPSGPAQQQNLLQRFFDLSGWLQSISNDMNRLGEGISGLAMALVLLGFVYSVVQGILGGGLEAIKGAFVRLAVVGLLLSFSTSGFVGNTLEGALNAAREWGTDSVANTLLDAGDNLDALAMRVVPFMGVVGALKIMTAKTAENAAKNAATRSVASGTSAGAAKVLQYLNWTTLLLIPLMLFFFILTVVASFTVEVGVALFPLAVALLVFPRGSAADWIGKWVAAVMGAILIVILLPVGFRAAVEIGINRPVNQVNAYVDRALERMREVKRKNEETLEEAKKKCRYNPLCHLEAKFNAGNAEIALALQALQTVIAAWLLGILLLLAGMGAAAYILFNIERVAMSFIGGFVATGVRQMLGTSSLGGRVYSGPGAAKTTSTVRDEPSFRMPAGQLPPPAYRMQPYYGGGSYGDYGGGSYRDDDIIEGEWRPAPPELPAAGNPRALPGPSNPRGLPGPSSD